MIAAIARISTATNRLTELILVPLVAFLAGVLIVAVFSRYVFQLSIVTATEMTRLAFVWGVFLGAAAGVKRGVHVRVVALVSRLPPRVGRLVPVVVHGSLLVFALLMLWHGATLTERMMVTTFPTLGITQGWLYLALPVSGALIAIHAFASLLTMRPVDPPSEIEGLTP
jgi:TRAP-type transport system small permease protein